MAVRKYVSKGNVFAALGFSREEAAVFAMRVELALVIRDFVERRKFTQTEAAKFFGVTQPKISRVLANRLQGFTIDYLVKLVSKTGKQSHLSFSATARSAAAQALAAS